MFLARVEGSVVATKKDASLSGRKLLLLRPQLVDDQDPSRFRPGVNTIVAVDSVGAGVGEMILFCQGSSARLARVTSAPSKTTRPLVGSTRRLMQRSNEDFPDPERPMSTTNSPRWISSETPFTARVPLG